MKQSIKMAIMKISLAIFGFFTGTAFLLGQDAGTTSKVTTTTTKTTWYAEPWVWVVGAAVFILILVSLLKGNSSFYKCYQDNNNGNRYIVCE